jgi:hypothetical protein
MHVPLPLTQKSFLRSTQRDVRAHTCDVQLASFAQYGPDLRRDDVIRGAVSNWFSYEVPTLLYEVPVDISDIRAFALYSYAQNPSSLPPSGDDQIQDLEHPSSQNRTSGPCFCCTRNLEPANLTSALV